MTKTLIKIIILLLIIAAPILLVMMFFKPAVKKKAQEHLEFQYRLPADVKSDDIKAVVAAMRKDSEFIFYFYALPQDSIDKATEETTVLLQNYGQKEALYEQMMVLQEKVRGYSTIFFGLDYPDDFFKNPTNYAEMFLIMLRFLQEEFKLTVLGISYKATFDPGFAFQWDLLHKQSAQKLYIMMLKLKKWQPTQ